MALPPPTKPEAPEAPPYRLDYAPLYQGLAQRGIVFTPAERAKFEQMLPATIDQFAVNQTIGNDIGGFLLKFFIMAIRGIQAFTEDGLPPGDNFGEWFEGKTTTALDRTNLHLVNQAIMKLNDNMRAEGGNLARAANLVTGVTVGRGPVVKMAGNLHSQLMQQAPGATPAEIERSYSLNAPDRLPVAEARHATYVPPATPSAPRAARSPA